jgi:hypothetical protein
MKRISKKNQQKIQNLLDKTGCISALCDGVDDLTVLLANINNIFSEFDDNGKPKEAIVLGTVHRTKGLEAHNVFVIDPENFPHCMATRQWEVQQERNLAYILVTRAKFQLSDKGEVIQPGRLIFIGQCPPIFKAQWLMGKAKYPVPEPTSGCISDGMDITGLTPVYNEEQELTHWHGFRNGQEVTVFND